MVYGSGVGLKPTPLPPPKAQTPSYVPAVFVSGLYRSWWLWFVVGCSHLVCIDITHVSPTVDGTGQTECHVLLADTAEYTNIQQE